MTINRDCIHGQLARSCEICELNRINLDNLAILHAVEKERNKLSDEVIRLVQKNTDLMVEIDRLKEVLEVRTQSWMNTTDALQERIAHFDILDAKLTRIKSLVDSLGSEEIGENLCCYNAWIELRNMLDER